MSAIDWQQVRDYVPRQRLRFVTATALFDGHDASINIFRRLLQYRGAEVIHLGHDRAAAEIARAALCEDVHGIAVSSYQGGHNEFFVYLRQLLDQQAGQHIKIFGGGGGVITPQEIANLQQQGISKIFSPEDGQLAGLEGIIGYMLHECDFKLNTDKGNNLPRALTLLEAQPATSPSIAPANHPTPVLGVTGSGGAGKSSLIDEILTRLLADFADFKIAVICIDPTKSKTGGALLGDRLRLNCAHDERVFVRSFATRSAQSEITSFLQDALHILQTHKFDLIVVETSGIGQANSDIVKVSDHSLYVMTPEYGAQSQLEKIDMLDYADFIAINKFERPQALDAIRDVRTQVRRSRFAGKRMQVSDYPVFGVIASRFNDDGVSGLYQCICAKIFPDRHEYQHNNRPAAQQSRQRAPLLPATRQQYLFDIAQAVRHYHRDNERIEVLLQQRDSLRAAQSNTSLSDAARAELQQAAASITTQLPPQVQASIVKWRELDAAYQKEKINFDVREKKIAAVPYFISLTENKLPKVARPRCESDAELWRYLCRENLPGSFPYTAGIMPFRRTQEDPQRQFAGEGSPQQTNKRFHYLSAELPAKRLSTAFDSVTLYGSDPAERPDIYGKVGESGVSVATLDDMQKLFAGFDLCAPHTSVSMTINGPAPIILAMYLNTAIAQQLAQHSEKNTTLSATEQQQVVTQTLQKVRGTVQADILKEDQAQNTCIFSTEFALRMMGDVQEYFIAHNIKKYYSVSISGFHIAEAGANPVTQLAFTLANGFTYVEYYLARGMKIDDFVPNLSFFFSSGLDPEYSVLGRVARRIWALALRDVYGASADSCKLKYHVQTSGRSLHAQEMTFNDIRTTLQALMALGENCNSLHTNAFDEALTTPTEESVRQAMAIQLIINRELGLNQCENFLQGSYFITYLTDLVEAQVLQEFERLAERGGVLGAMEAQYQRSKIQEQSLYYEELKHAGTVPIVGVNTFLTDVPGRATRVTTDLIRATQATKDQRLTDLAAFKQRNAAQAKVALQKLQQVVLQDENIFAELMQTVKYATLQEITTLLFALGGKYRRLM